MPENQAKAERVENDCHKDWKKNYDSWEFFRAAANAKLAEGLKNISGTYKKTKVETEGLVDPRNIIRKDFGPSSKYFIKFPLEGQGAYADRAKFAQDFGLSKTVLLTYVAQILKAALRQTTFQISSASNSSAFDEIKQILETDLDGNGMTLTNAVAKSAWETGAVGVSYVLVDKIEENFPTVKFIKRECVLDWYKNAYGKLEYAKIENYRDTFDPETLIKGCIEERIIYTLDMKEVWIKSEDKYVMESESVNTLGKIPLFESRISNDGESLIESLAAIQMNEMNVDSEMRQIVRQALVLILTGPEGLEDQLAKGVGIGSYFESDKEARDLEFVAPNEKIIDGHLNYWKWILERGRDISKVSKSTEGGTDTTAILVKQFNHLDIEAILNFLATGIETQIKNAIGCVLEWQNKGDANNVVFQIDKQFNVKDVQQVIQEALGAKAYGLGELAETRIGQKLRDAIVKLNEDEIQISDSQIEKLHGTMSEEDMDSIKNLITKKGENENGQKLEPDNQKA